MKLCNLAVMLLLCFLNACTTYSNIPRDLSAVQLPPPTVTLGPDDVIDVKFRYWPELDQTQTIRPDGMISLELVNDVAAAGLSPDELRRKLLELYATKLKEPVITVIVRKLANQQIYVGGEVLSPGMIPLVGQMSVMEALMAAGGQNKLSAQMRNVIVIRRIGDKNHTVALDLRRVLESPTSDPFFLAPHDIVFVPRTRIDNVDQWVAQYIDRVVPQTALQFSYQGKRTQYGYGIH